MARDSISKMTFLPKFCQVELGYSCLMSRASSLSRPKKYRVHLSVSQKRKLLTELRTEQRIDRKAKSEQFFTCATPPTVVSTVTSTRGRLMASSAGGSPHSPPSPPGRPHLQTTFPGATCHLAATCVQGKRCPSRVVRRPHIQRRLHGEECLSDMCITG